MQPLRIGFVRVFVSDFARALTFYRDTLSMPLDYTDGEFWAQFHAGEDISLAIELCPPDKTECGSPLVGRFVGVTLLADDLQATYDLLISRRVEFTAPPAVQPWGGKLAHFRDPDGNMLTLMESRDD